MSQSSPLGGQPQYSQHQDPSQTSHTFTLPSSDNRSKPATKNEDIKIPEIPHVASPSSDASPQALAAGLVGKRIGEYGEVLDADGKVVGRVQGDLPSMMGKTVGESGKVLDDDGEVTGYVSDNYTKRRLKDLGRGLSVDESGDIYNAGGKVIGRLDEEAIAELLRSSPPKSTSTPSPSEVALDVKSTHDGIQVILKIPTVFK